MTENSIHWTSGQGKPSSKLAVGDSVYAALDSEKPRVWDIVEIYMLGSDTWAHLRSETLYVKENYYIRCKELLEKIIRTSKEETDMTEQTEMQLNETEQDEVALPGESKAERFRRVATRRLNATLKQIELLGNCANKASYEFTPQQVATILAHVEEAVEELKRAYTAQGKTERHIAL